LFPVGQAGVAGVTTLPLDEEDELPDDDVLEDELSDWKRVLEGNAVVLDEFTLEGKLELPVDDDEPLAADAPPVPLAVEAKGIVVDAPPTWVLPPPPVLPELPPQPARGTRHPANAISQKSRV
jgi:hypothetical protein